MAELVQAIAKRESDNYGNRCAGTGAIDCGGRAKQPAREPRSLERARAREREKDETWWFGRHLELPGEEAG